jgi:AcrR family transcriptional regulator
VPRAALTDEQLRDFRARAVAVATRLFARDGYEAVTMRAIAAELGCSPMTPYRYFEDKDALFAAVRTAAFRRFADRQQSAFESTDDPAEQLERLHRAYIAFALAEPDAYRIMFELRQEPSVAQSELAAETARAFSYLHRATEAAVAIGLIQGDPLTQAHLFWAAVHGLVALHLAGKLSVGRTLDELIRALPSVSKRGKGKKP